MINNFDYQKVTLVSVSSPKIFNEKYLRMMTAEEFIGYCARVSNPSNQNNTDTIAKLLNYCIINKHWSIFEMVHVVLEIETTRDIGRQILRHKSFSFQELSQRYTDATQLGLIEREARLQDNKNRQNSIDIKDDTKNELIKSWNLKQKQIQHECKMTYNWAIENGIAKEQARCILPEGLTMSRMYVAGNLRSWITYIALREKNGTQKEHMDIAIKCKKIISDEFPQVSDSLGGVYNRWNV